MHLSLQCKHQTFVLCFHLISVPLSLSNMDSLSILKFTASLPCFCLLLLNASTMNPIFALNKCNFPAIFNFGDSNSDTGGLSATLRTPRPRYGETYVHKPAKRFSDSQLIIDFMGVCLVFSIIHSHYTYNYCTCFMVTLHGYSKEPWSPISERLP